MKEYPIGYKLDGKELEEALLLLIQQNIQSLYDVLSEYDCNALFEVWLKFIRYQEELINICFELDGEELEKVLSSEIGTCFICNYSFFEAQEIVSKRFGQDVANRFCAYVRMFSRQNSILETIKANYLNIHSIGDLFTYSQSRRLYYVTILHLIPKYAKGNKRIRINEIPNEFGAYIDINLRNVTSQYHSLIQNRCLNDFYAESTDFGLLFNSQYTHLEPLFLEPLRLSSLDILQFDNKFDASKLKPAKPRYSLYSFEELDDTVRLDAQYFAEFDLKSNRTFMNLCDLIDWVKPFFVDGYSIIVPKEDFSRISKKTGLVLYKEESDYFDLLNTRVAFVKNNDNYYSTFYLLQRYVENSIYRILRRNKKYQIKSGFVFENKVASLLENYGFDKVSGVKRINHKEFDVVCKKNNRIFNFQCKNNYFNASEINSNRLNVSVRYHKYLANYYNKALKKELDREYLLKEKIGNYEVENYVITRFPVITSNPRVIPFNTLERWLMDN